MDVKNYRVPKTQSTEIKMFSQLKCPREDTSVPLGRENKTIKNGEFGRDLAWKADKGEWGETGT